MLIKKFLFASVLLAGVLFLPFVSFAQTVNSTSSVYFQKGMSGDFVKDLQNELRNDPSIYPQGLVTGFYGNATEQAILKIQARYGLPQTGIVDQATVQVLFPNNVQMKVIAPNGGEVWNKSNNATISWSVTVGPIIVNGQQLAPSASSNPGGVVMPSVRPIFDLASIDLIKDSDPNFVYHIATVDLYQTQYYWDIPDSVSNTSDYRIKISVGGNVPCIYRMESISSGDLSRPCPLLYPQYHYFDTSDNTFSITGTGTSDDRIIKLRELIRQMQQMLNNLQSQLNSMSQLLSNL